MADHTLDRQVGIDRLADDIKQVKNQISELRTIQVQGSDALNLNIVNDSFSVSIAANTIFYIGIILSSASGRRIFAAPMDFTLYEGSIAPGNEIGQGNARDVNYIWYYYRDKSLNNSFSIAERVKILQDAGNPQTVWIDATIRFILAPDVSA